MAESCRHELPFLQPLLLRLKAMATIRLSPRQPEPPPHGADAVATYYALPSSLPLNIERVAAEGCHIHYEERLLFPRTRRCCCCHSDGIRRYASFRAPYATAFLSFFSATGTFLLPSFMACSFARMPCCAAILLMMRVTFFFAIFLSFIPYADI